MLFVDRQYETQGRYGPLIYALRHLHIHTRRSFLAMLDDMSRNTQLFERCLVLPSVEPTKKGCCAGEPCSVSNAARHSWTTQGAAASSSLCPVKMEIQSATSFEEPDCADPHPHCNRPSLAFNRHQFLT